MSSKYNGRNLPAVSRSDAPSDFESELMKSMEKSSARPKAKEGDLYNQISAIMGRKSKYPTVAAAVQDMAERTGLKAYLDQIKAAVDGNVKLADENFAPKEQIKLFTICPQIKSTFDNYINGTHGVHSIPATIGTIKAIHSRDASDEKDWDDEALAKYVSDKRTEAQKMHPMQTDNHHNLGKPDKMMDADIDPSNTDAFFGLMPAHK